MQFFCCPLIIYLYFIFNNPTTRVKKFEVPPDQPTHLILEQPSQTLHATQINRNREFVKIML